MIRPSPEALKALATLAKQPAGLKFIHDWMWHELHDLPKAVKNPRVSQGRCQVLCELYKLLKESPDIVAKPGFGGTPLNSTHTDRSV